MKRKRSMDEDQETELPKKVLKTSRSLCMKMDEKIIALLKEVKVNTKKMKNIEDFVSRLKTLLLSEDFEKGFKSNDIGKLKKMVPSYPCKEAFQFMRPISTLICGSCRLGTSLKMGLKVDVCVVIPKGCLDPKDYLNQRYLYKRAIYMAYIASFLSKKRFKSLIEGVQLEFERGIHVRPQLIIKPSAMERQFVICLKVQAETDSFKLNRFGVNTNNIRQKTYKPTMLDDAENYPATPHYNSWVLLDLTSELHLQNLEKALEGQESIKDAIILLKIWLHQRQLDLGFGGFSGFIMTSFVVYLMLNGKLSELVFSYQIFQNVLSVLAKSDWSVHGITMSIRKEKESKALLEDFHSRFEVVFIDSSGCLNLCADMSKSMFEVVQQEAQLSLQMMNTSTEFLFENLWMTSLPFARKYDEIFQIDFSGHMKRCPEPKKHLKDCIMDFCGNFLVAYLPWVTKLLKSALHKRVKLLAAKHTVPAPWSVNESPPLLKPSQVFGILLERPNCYSQVERGPIGNSQEAVEFQKLWGEKAELRRFQDGITCEAAVWPSETCADKRTIVKRIIRYILLRHTSVIAEDMLFVTGCLDRFLHLPQQLTKKSAFTYATGEEEHSRIITSLDALSKDIRSIDDLPLKIDSVKGLSPVFCYSEVFPALSGVVETRSTVDGNRLIPDINGPIPLFTPSMTVLCLLERSGKWPADRDICEALKLSFLARLKLILESKFGLLSAFNKDSLSVYKDGYVFRLLLGFTHEITMSLMADKHDDAVVKQKDVKDSLALERLMVTTPCLISMLHGIYCQNSSFSSVCRLAKRWLASHLLFDNFYLDEMALQIIVASLYVNSAPFLSPCSLFTGFIRFLHLMATHDWVSLPLIVNFNDELKVGDYEEIINKFVKERSTLPVMFISTPVDRFSQMFTKKHPTTHILTRIATLANESLSSLLNQMENFELKMDAKNVFEPHSEVFDVIIHLNPDVCSRAHFALNLGPDVNIPTLSINSSKNKIPVYDYDMALEYLQQLRANFSEFALFFYDVFGGKYIGVAWKPSAFTPMIITTSHLTHRTVTVNENEEMQLIPNVSYILKEFEQMSPRVVKSTEVRRLCPATLQ